MAKRHFGGGYSRQIKKYSTFLDWYHNCGLRAGDEHYDLRRDGPSKMSQFTFRCNSQGARCLVYQEDCITKTNDGGLNSMKKERKIVWIHPSENVMQCPV